MFSGRIETRAKHWDIEIRSVAQESKEIVCYRRCRSSLDSTQISSAAGSAIADVDGLIKGPKVSVRPSNSDQLSFGDGNVYRTDYRGVITEIVSGWLNRTFEDKIVINPVV